MPVDKETNLISYNGIFEAKGVADSLYKKGLKWFNTNYKNPTDVIKEKQEGVKIAGKARFTIYSTDAKTGTQMNDGVLNYDITLNFKDGKCKYEITNIYQKNPSHLGIEKWVEDNNKAYNAVFSSYLVQTDDYFKDLVVKMKKAVTTAEIKKSDNW